MSRGKTAARAKEIYQRQRPYRFGPSYQAATRATREEAPPNSRPSQLRSPRLGRALQLLSIPERKAVELALYNPAVCEIFDQYALWPGPYMNPLAALDSTRAVNYPGFEGTVEVADRLGLLKHHPTFSFEKDGVRKRAPWPLQGDLLVFIKENPKYRTVNWSVKKTQADFSEPPAGSAAKEAKKREALLARREIEVLYHLDVGNRTHHVTENQIDQIVSANLHKLCMYSAIDALLPQPLAEDLLMALRIGVDSGYPPSETISRLVATGRYDPEQARVCFYQAIWNRDLRVDLQVPIRIDRPLHPEQTDVLTIYDEWFS